MPLENLLIDSEMQENFCQCQHLRWVILFHTVFAAIAVGNTIYSCFASNPAKRAAKGGIQ
ncbi:MAG: hypothetical protein L6V84_08525 [Oscillospiraceae bacterium]|nr:MAG: hypothetical protein L6V84_08525 [Oscillospiraceae bacterium]